MIKGQSGDLALWVDMVALRELLQPKKQARNVFKSYQTGRKIVPERRQNVAALSGERVREYAFMVKSKSDSRANGKEVGI